MKTKDKEFDTLGEGIIIGLTYGIGLFVFGFFRDSIFGLSGLIFFIAGYIMHTKVLTKINKNKK